MSAAFDLIAERIGEFDESDAAASQASEEARSPSPSAALSDEMLAAAEEAVQAASTTNDGEAAISTSAIPTGGGAATAEASDMTAETADAADAHDDAILDMIALEMAAPDPSNTGDNFNTDIDEIHVPEPPPADPEIVAERPEPVVAPQPSPIQPSFQPSLEVSLGSTLIANGIVRRSHLQRHLVVRAKIDRLDIAPSP